MVESFGSRLREHCASAGRCAWALTPVAQLIEAWGREDSVEGLEFFALAVLEAVSGYRGRDQAPSCASSSASARRAIASSSE